MWKRLVLLGSLAISVGLAQAQANNSATYGTAVTLDIQNDLPQLITFEGKAGDIIKKIIKELKPESIYFTEQGGTRGAVAVVYINDPSQIPSFSEPFFLNFNADCEFRIAMSPEDLGKAGLDELGKKWS